MPNLRFTIERTEGVSDLGRLMRRVLLCLSPGIAIQVFQWGPGVLLHCLLAILMALLGEATVLALRGRGVWSGLRDSSAVLTAVLLALSLPPMAPGWLVSVGSLFAVVVGKQLYGGLGFNPFNPAMVGYAVLLISFPREMTEWRIEPGSSLAWTALLEGRWPDGVAMATPLDSLKTRQHLEALGGGVETGLGLSLPEVVDWWWINFGYLMGGVGLLISRAVDWRIPIAFLVGLGVVAGLAHQHAPVDYPSAIFHLSSGATMLGAFFIMTDPVTAPTTPKGRWLYGVLAGLLVWLIRSWGGYPDGVAFAVLLLNFAAPTIDRHTRPRIYGHSR